MEYGQRCGAALPDVLEKQFKKVEKNKKRISLQAPKRVGPPIKNQGTSDQA